MEDSLCQGPMKFLAHQGLFEHGCCTRLSRFLTSDIVVEFLFKNVFKKVENDGHELSCQTKRELGSLFVEFNILVILSSQWARKFKKVQAKKHSWNQINQFHEKIFLTKIHFLPFQKWPKINFWTGKKFKTVRNAISRKNCFIWFHEFFLLSGLF